MIWPTAPAETDSRYQPPDTGVFEMIPTPVLVCLQLYERLGDNHPAESSQPLEPRKIITTKDLSCLSHATEVEKVCFPAIGEFTD